MSLDIYRPEEAIPKIYSEKRPELNLQIGAELRKIISDKTTIHNFEGDNEYTTKRKMPNGEEYNYNYVEIYKGKNIDLIPYGIDGYIIELEQVNKKTEAIETNLFFMKHSDDGKEDAVKIHYLQPRKNGEIIPHSIVDMQGLIGLITNEITVDNGGLDPEQLKHKFRKK